MSVSLIVPWRPDGAERDRNWRWLKARYRQMYPDWELIEGRDGGEGPWSKGRAVADALVRASGDVVAVVDADVMVGAAVLPQAVERLDEAPWVVPHRLVYRLSEESTRALIDGRLLAHPSHLTRERLRRAVRKGPAGGGAVIAKAADMEAVGGIDSRFTEWGGEDISFARALDTLIGPRLRLDSIMWHLDHEPMPIRDGHRASPENEALAAQYLDAEGDAVAMAGLCEQAPYSGLEGGGIVVAEREVVQSIPPDPRFVGWG